MTIGTAIFMSVGFISFVIVLLVSSYTRPVQSLPCMCKDCTNYKDCPIGAGKAILIWKEKESQDLSDKI